MEGEKRVKKYFHSLAGEREHSRKNMDLKKRTLPKVDEAHVKLIMGLKLKQLRAEKGLSLAELAARTGISVSYLNEIEKGKKSPKADKVSLLAAALDVSYDWLVSLKMNKKLAPVAEILQSSIMKEILLDVFGIDKAQLLDLLSRVPVKLNAFLNTVIEVSRNYGMRVENFYFAALRSYQEMHENYFDDMEIAVDQFTTENGIDTTKPVSVEMLAQILQSTYDYQIEDDGLSSQPELKELRSVLLSGKKPRLLLNRNLSRTQKAFILGREIGFQFMKITERPLTTSWVELDSFEQVLNNFKGSYFSCALLLNRQQLVRRLEAVFAGEKFNSQEIVKIMDDFNVSPEIFMHRLTTLLPRYFGIQELFFLRFSTRNGSEEFELTKEMHLAGLHNPHANMMNEHYCRRWISINILKELSFQLRKGLYHKPLCMAQRSRYFGNENEYLIISFAKPAIDGININNSVSVGLLLTNQLKKKVKFWNDPAIPIRMVGETCQRCPATDCVERIAPPEVLQQVQRISSMKTALSALSGN
jgi:XRE family transcriptional regulator, fatty acid utilization regulator